MDFQVMSKDQYLRVAASLRPHETPAQHQANWEAFLEAAQQASEKTPDSDGELA